MNIEDKINSESLKMADRYYTYYVKKYPRNKNQVINKYKGYFDKASRMFCIRDNFNAKFLIDSFMADGFKFPQQLPNEMVWKTYLDYLPGLHEDKAPEIIVAEAIVNAALSLKREGTVANYLNKTINKQQFFEGKQPFDILLFSFSHDFIKFYKENELNFKNKIDFVSVRNRVFMLDGSNRIKIINKIKELLKDDYYTYLTEMQKQFDKAGFIF